MFRLTSGAMPYAQLHYPFENKEIVDNRSYYPADFIAEGVDQTSRMVLYASCYCYDGV